MRNLKKLTESNPELSHNVMRRLGQLIIVDIFITMFLFISAGTFYWFYAWVYIAFWWLMTLVAPIVAPPELLAERGSKKENVEKWDKIITIFLV